MAAIGRCIGRLVESKEERIVRELSDKLSAKFPLQIDKIGLSNTVKFFGYRADSEEPGLHKVSHFGQITED